MVAGLEFVEYKEDGSSVEGVKEVESKRMKSMVLRSGLVPLKPRISLTTGPGGTDEKMEVIHKGIRSILDGLCLCQGEGNELSMSADSC